DVLYGKVDVDEGEDQSGRGDRYQQQLPEDGKARAVAEAVVAGPVQQQRGHDAPERQREGEEDGAVTDERRHWANPLTVRSLAERVKTFFPPALERIPWASSGCRALRGCIPRRAWP